MGAWTEITERPNDKERTIAERKGTGEEGETEDAREELRREMMPYEEP